MRNASLLRYGSVILALCSAGLLVHCSDDGGGTAPAEENDTGTAEETSTTDTSTPSETSTEETGDETSTSETGDETSTSETGGETGAETSAETSTDAGCGTLSATATDVYVDKASTKPSVGTLDCPFKTIKEATDLAAVSGRKIHVKGGGSSLTTYNETGALQVKGGVTLLGDGAASTKIVAAGGCGEGMCAVEVAAGATVDGFNIASTGNGIVTLDGGTDATVKNVLVTGGENGVVVLGPAALTGNVQSNKNTKSGLFGKGTKTIKVSGTGNEFNENEINGIVIEGSARLELTGGTANSNKSHGVHLKSTTVATSTGRHTISGLTANSNGRSSSGTVISTANGLVLENTGSLTLRSSKLLTNSHHGVVVFIGGNTFDIASGGNTFGVGTPTTARNAHAGICLENTGATGSIGANGNSWNACSGLVTTAPTQTETTGNCTAYSTQVDIAYKKASGGGTNPLDFSGLGACTVGTP